MKQFWDNIDGVCVINLDHRTDRWEELHSELLQFIPAEKIHRVSAVWGKKLPSYQKHRLFKGCNEDESLFWAGRAGCVLSHTKCIQMAKDQGWRNILVLEDDAHFVNDMKGKIGEMVQRVIQQDPQWDMFFLGLAPYDDQAALIDSCTTAAGQQVRAMRIMGPLNAHCYMVNAKLFDRYLSHLPKRAEDIWYWLAMNLSYDSWIANDIARQRATRTYGLYPIVCVQRDSWSDIEHIARSGGTSGAIGDPAFPVTEISLADFEKRYRQPKFILKKACKIGMHYALGCFYYLVGYRKFKVSVANAGYWGALKAAWADLKNRNKA